MKRQKPKLVTGTRDFGPEVMGHRMYMMDVIRGVFEQYGFAPMETPAMEELATLMGKYGDEGEQLIFKILDSGDFLQGLGVEPLEGDYKVVSQSIAHKGLRYDLTVPLARYVAQHRHAITFPFKRYQMQPVWRADRPQKGRFREFYQCDADIVGGDSVFYETEMLGMVHDVLGRLGVDDFLVELNHRLILRALAERLGVSSQESLLCGTLDKLDKMGWERVVEMLRGQGFSAGMVDDLEAVMAPLLEGEGVGLDHLQRHLGMYEAGEKALEDLERILGYMDQRGLGRDKVVLTPTLARGMGYYTGAIFEVKVRSHLGLGSVSAGGRYDDLATVFGVPPLPSVGFSLGLERIYEVLLAKNLFPQKGHRVTELLMVPMGVAEEKVAMQWLMKVRAKGICAELYPVGPRLKKTLAYANGKGIPYVAIFGEAEGEERCTLKDMGTGNQILCSFDALVERVKSVRAKEVSSLD